MISQSIAAVVLPAGRGPGGTLRANVYLAPRLSGAQRLSHFPDWLDWTALVRQHGLRFTLASGSAERDRRRRHHRAAPGRLDRHLQAGLARR